MNKKNFITVKVQHVLCTAFPEAKSHNRVSRNFFWKQSGKVLIVRVFLNVIFSYMFKESFMISSVKWYCLKCLEHMWVTLFCNFLKQTLNFCIERENCFTHNDQKFKLTKAVSTYKLRCSQLRFMHRAYSKVLLCKI